MLIDDTFISRFKDQITVLTKLKQSVTDAIDDANKKLKLLNANPGKNIHDVIPPPTKQSPGGRGKDHKDHKDHK